MSECPQAPKDESLEELGFAKQDMVNWFHPTQLARTAVQVVMSLAFGAYADKRELQAALLSTGQYDYHEHDDIWFDFIADLGDGFNSTYTMAYLLAQESLTLNDTQTKRGKLLVMGGDEVYPVASREQYRNRFEGPYRSAMPWQPDEKCPDLYALPGNHDWYDGLTAFTRLFCQNRWIGAWRTRQHRSYFAIELPHRWWLFAVDIQLGADIDKPQLDYFRDICKSLQEGDNVILCTAAPVWLKKETSPFTAAENLNFLETRLIQKAGAEIRANIAGDLHHYCRYEANAETKRQRITSGGGGAFLHGTHGKGLPDELSTKDGDTVTPYRKQVTFPTAEESQSTLKGNFKFGVYNWQFSLVFGVAYLLNAWFSSLAASTQGANFIDTLSAVSIWSLPFDAPTLYLGLIPHSPMLLAYILFLVAAMIGFCEPSHHVTPKVALTQRIITGFIHALVHILASLVLLKLFACVDALLGLRSLLDSGVFLPLLHGIFYIVCFLTIGSLLAGSIIGVYLFVTNRWLDFHGEAALSSNRIAHFKNFLRLHIDSNGDLTIYPIGVRRTLENWKLNPRASNGESWFRSSDDSPNALVELIEAPIVLKKPLRKGSTHDS